MPSSPPNFSSANGRHGTPPAGISGLSWNGRQRLSKSRLGRSHRAFSSLFSSI